jgi:hypothetical protein
MFGGKIGIPELIFLFPVFCVVVPVWMIGWWKIFTKAGYSGALSIIMLFPLINFIGFFWFAFSRWPIEKYQPSSMSQGQSA